MINSTSRFANLFRNVLKKQGVTVDRIVFDKCSGGFVIPSSGAKPLHDLDSLPRFPRRLDHRLHALLEAPGCSHGPLPADQVSSRDVPQTQCSLLINTTGRLLAADSDNLYAEVFARTLGAFFTPPNQTSSSTLNDGLALIAQVPSAKT